MHGNSSCKEIFIRQFNEPALSQYRLFALDLPGHGASDNSLNPSNDYKIPAIARVITKVLKKNEIVSPLVFGWSLGGHIAIEMAGQGVEMRGLAISGTPPVGPGIESLENVFVPSPHMALTGKVHFTEEEARMYAQRTISLHQPVPEYLLKQVRRTDGQLRHTMLTHWYEGKEGHNQVDVVGALKIPIAVIQGEAEAFFSNDYFEKITWNNLWGNRVCIIPESGHAPFWENPKLFNSNFRTIRFRLCWEFQLVVRLDKFPLMTNKSMPLWSEPPREFRRPVSLSHAALHDRLNSS